MTPNNDKEPSALQFLSLGINIAAGFCIFVLGGIWLDTRFQTGIVFTLTGAAIAFALSIYTVYKSSVTVHEK